MVASTVFLTAAQLQTSAAPGLYAGGHRNKEASGSVGHFSQPTVILKGQKRQAVGEEKGGAN